MVHHDKFPCVTVGSDALGRISFDIIICAKSELWPDWMVCF